MMTLLITWPGVIAGVVGTIFVEALVLIIYAVSKYWK